MQKCPVPGCEHVFDILTIYHCETSHNMTRKELLKKHGKPTFLRIDGSARTKNLKLHKSLSSYDFRM